MVMIGIDPHKHNHTAVAVDPGTGAQLARLSVRADEEGCLRLLAWAREQGGQRRWAIEDCRHVSGRLERLLLWHGEAVVRVPPKLMGRLRREARTYGKSDPIDAAAVARAALREPELPAARLEGPAREARLLVDRREDLVAERTREANRLRWLLHDLDVSLSAGPGALSHAPQLERIQQSLAAMPDDVRVALAREIADRIGDLNRRIGEHERQIRRLVRSQWPELTEIPGCAELTAAKIVGEIGDITRFANDAQLAMHAGTAPIPVSSGHSDRVRLNRHGNRQLNLAIHRIAVVQRRHHPQARHYIDRRLSEGKSKREALRSLKRHLTRRVYRTLQPAPA